MSSAVLAGMRLKPRWLWFISASSALTLYLWTYTVENVAICVVLSKGLCKFLCAFLVSQTVIYNWALGVFKIRLNVTHICSQHFKSGRPVRLWSEGSRHLFSSLQSIIIWHYYTSWPVGFSRRERLKSVRDSRARTCQQSCWMDKGAHLCLAWLILVEPLSRLL